MSQTTNLRRIVKEAEDLNNLSDEYATMFEVEIIEDNMFHWNAMIYGPPDTLYAGYEFLLDIVLPADYPNAPPTVKFITPISHVNVNQSGDICLDIIKTEEWKRTLTIRSVILSVISLLGDPNVTDPLNADLAEIFRRNKADYEKCVRTACRKHAKKIKA